MYVPTSGSPVAWSADQTSEPYWLLADTPLAHWLTAPVLGSTDAAGSSVATGESCGRMDGSAVSEAAGDALGWPGDDAGDVSDCSESHASVRAAAARAIGSPSSTVVPRPAT